jgi:predicted nucleic acid-binding protein
MLRRIPPECLYFIKQVFDEQFFISVVVKIEVLGFDELPHKMDAMEKFIGMAQVFLLDENITNRTIDLRRKYKKLHLGDAVIAATAIEHNLFLITHNIDDFKKIEGLNLINPYSI